jgi:hypothetical protein
MGQYSNAHLYGLMAHSSFEGNVKGDCQYDRVLFKANNIVATNEEELLSGDGERYTLSFTPTPGNFIIKLTVVGNGAAENGLIPCGRAVACVEFDDTNYTTRSFTSLQNELITISPVPAVGNSSTDGFTFTITNDSNTARNYCGTLKTTSIAGST